MTPARIATEVRTALDQLPAAHPARPHLVEALDAIADGMPGDYVERILLAALRELQAG